MDEKQLTKFKKLLEDKKQQLEDELANFAKRDTGSEGDWNAKFPTFGREENVDLELETDEVEEYISRLPVEQTLELRLKDVNDALERIKKGTYGICANCKKNIPLKRLEAMPETNVCLKCQNKKSR